jgi:hypothetical protein
MAAHCIKLAPRPPSVGQVSGQNTVQVVDVPLWVVSAPEYAVEIIDNATGILLNQAFEFRDR